MRQLFCIINILASLSSLSLFGNTLGANDSINIIENKTNFEDEDAYYIYNNTKLEFINENSDKEKVNYTEYSFAKKIVISYSYRLKLNTNIGVENYAYISINQEEKAIINSFEVKTFKSNGEIVKFDSTKIFHSSIPNLLDKKNNLEITKYVIPGVEVGDEIEINYSIEISGNLTEKFFGNVFLNNFIPSLHSEYKIIIPYPYKIFFKCYNGLKSPKMHYDKLRTINTFSLDSVPAVKDLYYTCLYDEFPYFYYSIEYRIDIAQFLKWKDYYNYYINFLYSKISYDATPRRLKRWFKKNLKEIKDQNKFQKFEYLYNKIKNNFEIYPNKLPLSITSYEDLLENKINRNNLFKLYVKILDYLEIDYYLCFGRNKYNGSIDKNFLRKDEITDFLLMYYKNDSELTFIYPHEVLKKYYLNEIPSYLNGTELFIVKKDNQNNPKRKFELTNISNDSLLLIKKVLVNKNGNNIYHRLRAIGVDLKSDETKYNSIINFSGYSSTDYRHLYINLLKNKEHNKLFSDEIQKGRDLFKVDSIYFKSENIKYPFKYSVGITGKLNKFFNYINDSTIIISVNEILNNNKIEFDQQYRKLNIVLPYAFSDIQDLIIDFNKPIYIINKDLLNKKFDNSIGSYKFETKILGDKKLRLTSTYTIKKDLIEKKSFRYLNEINEASNEMSNTRIIIGIKK